LRQDHSARAGDADRLIQLLHGSLDIVVGFEHRVGVENEFDIGVELARLPLDGWCFSDWRSALDDRQVDLLQRTEQSGANHRTVRASVVDENNSPRTKRLARHRLEAEHDVLRLVQRRDHHVDGCRSPIFGRRRRCRIGAPEKTAQA
jgi:hypothetical protein